MADAAARESARPRFGLAALTAATLAVATLARPASATEVGAVGVMGRSDSTATALAEAAPAVPGFTVRRIANPHYRPPLGRAPSLPVGATATLRALDWARAQLAGRGAGPGSRTLDWLVAGGEQGRDDRQVALEATGTRQGDVARLRTLRLDAHQGALTGALGDVTPVTVDRVATIQRLRGALLALERRDGTSLRALGGVPSPLPGQPTRRLDLGGLSLENLPFEEGRVTASAFAYGIGRAPRQAALAGDADTLAGGGGITSLGVRAPLGPGTLGSQVTAGWHRRGDTAGLSAQHALGWDLARPTLVLSLRDERGTDGARLLGSDRVSLAPRREDRWNAQQRFLKGRAESHFTGVLRDGGDAALETRSITLGGSGAFGASAWYGGGDLAWDARGGIGGAERRTSLYTGRVAAGASMLLRAERTTNGQGRDAVRVTGETSIAVVRGARLALEPRAGWDALRFSQASLGARVTWPLAALGARIGAGLVVGAERARGFRGAVREAELALSLMPRARDRGELDLRRVDEGGGAGLEYTASYEAQQQRYESANGWFSSRRDSSRVLVQVVRSGNRSGVADVLVSLDGRELRFTDDDGIARFEHVDEGVHVVALEERSLPPQTVPATVSRVFVTVERGRITEPVVFEIGRPERRMKF